MMTEIVIGGAPMTAKSHSPFWSDVATPAPFVEAESEALIPYFAKKPSSIATWMAIWWTSPEMTPMDTDVIGYIASAPLSSIALARYPSSTYLLANEWVLLNPRSDIVLFRLAVYS